MVGTVLCFVSCVDSFHDVISLVSTVDAPGPLSGLARIHEPDEGTEGFAKIV